MDHALDDTQMSIHFFFGYILAFLIIFRIILFFTGDRRVLAMAKKAFDPLVPKHKPLVNWLYLTFYAGLIVMAISGLLMRFKSTFGITATMKSILLTIHVSVMCGLLTFVIVHLAGLFIAENTKQPGVVSSMMSGVGEEDEVMKTS